MLSLNALEEHLNVLGVKVYSIIRKKFPEYPIIIINIEEKVNNSLRLGILSYSRNRLSGSYVNSY